MILAERSPHPPRSAGRPATRSTMSASSRLRAALNPVCRPMARLVAVAMTAGLLAGLVAGASHASTVTPTTVAASNKPCMPNVLKCAKQGFDNIGKYLDNPAAPVANAVLRPMADGVASLTNQMVRVILTEWLYQPSLRVTNSGITLRNDPDRPKNGAGVGCLNPQQPGSAPPPTAPPTPPPTSPPSPPPTRPSPSQPPPPSAPAPIPIAQNQGDPNRNCDDKTLPDVAASNQISTVKVQGVMLGVGALVAAILTFFQAMRTAFTRKGAPLLEALRGLLIMAAHVAFAITLLDSLLIASDALTKAIIDSSLGRDLGMRMFQVLTLSTAVLGPVPVIMFGVIIFIVGLLQLATLFFRQAAIPVLAMLFPVAAAAQVGGQTSRQLLVRLWAALFAIVLYKPLAALIFVVGFLEVGNGRGFWDVVRGLVTLLLAVIALPMLMRVLQPIVGQAVGDGYQEGFGKLWSAASEAVTSTSNVKSLIGGTGAGKGGGGDTTPADPSTYENYTTTGHEDPPANDDDAGDGRPGDSPDRGPTAPDPAAHGDAAQGTDTKDAAAPTPMAPDSSPDAPADTRAATEPVPATTITASGEPDGQPSPAAPAPQPPGTGETPAAEPPQDGAP